MEGPPLPATQQHGAVEEGDGTWGAAGTPGLLLAPPVAEGGCDHAEPAVPAAAAGDEAATHSNGPRNGSNAHAPAAQRPPGAAVPRDNRRHGGGPQWDASRRHKAASCAVNTPPVPLTGRDVTRRFQGYAGNGLEHDGHQLHVELLMQVGEGTVYGRAIGAARNQRSGGWGGKGGAGNMTRASLRVTSVAGKQVLPGGREQIGVALLVVGVAVGLAECGSAIAAIMTCTCLNLQPLPLTGCRLPGHLSMSMSNVQAQAQRDAHVHSLQQVSWLGSGLGRGSHTPWHG